MAVLRENRVDAFAEKELKRKMAVEAKAKLYAQKKQEKEAQKKYKEEYKDFLENKHMPRVFDISDTADFFNPIMLFKDKDGNVLETDYQDFLKHEKELKTKIDENQKDIYYEDLLGEKTEQIPEDKDNNKSLPEIKDKGLKEIISNHNLTLAQHFNRYTPKYNLRVCTCCGKSLKLENFSFGWNFLYANAIDSRGIHHTPWCNECSQKLFDYFYEEKADKDPQLAMEMWCCATYTYFDADTFKTARVSAEKQNRNKHVIGTYMQLLSRKENCQGKTFWDSDIIQNKEITLLSDEDYKDITPYNWSKEDAQNRNTVLKMVGYDCFQYESDENKKVLYKDLLNILDIGMENDLVKLQAAIQIVNSFFRVRMMDKQYAELQKKIGEKDSKVTYKDLSELAKLKKTELDAITSFARDNGFSERYASAKAKGENTLTGIMTKMSNQKYEKAVVNRYDIETSETIQQAANASFKAIFSQLSLGETDVWKICQNQLEELKKIRKENSDLQEKNRKLHCEISEMELKQKAIEKGIQVEE